MDRHVLPEAARTHPAPDDVALPTAVGSTAPPPATFDAAFDVLFPNTNNTLAGEIVVCRGYSFRRETAGILHGRACPVVFRRVCFHLPEQGGTCWGLFGRGWAENGIRQDSGLFTALKGANVVCNGKLVTISGLTVFFTLFKDSHTVTLGKRHLGYIRRTRYNIRRRSSDDYQILLVPPYSLRLIQAQHVCSVLIGKLRRMPCWRRQSHERT